MKKQKAIYISSKLIPEIIDTINIVKGEPANLYIAAGLEVLEMFGNIAETVTNVIELKIEEKEKINSIRDMIKMEEQELMIKHQELVNSLKNNTAKEQFDIELAAKTSEYIEIILEALQHIECGTNLDIYEYQRKALVTYKDIIKIFP